MRRRDPVGLLVLLAVSVAAIVAAERGAYPLAKLLAMVTLGLMLAWLGGKLWRP